MNKALKIALIALGFIFFVLIIGNLLTLFLGYLFVSGKDDLGALFAGITF